jgi:4-phytase/acid phosphatase
VSNSLAKSLLLACLCVWSWAPSEAQAVKFSSASRQPEEHLRMVVILSRHGVRSPTWTQERLDSYSALPWPKWSVPPGNLTERGYRLIKQFASFDRTSLGATGLVSTQGCNDAAQAYVWADTDQRTVASGKAFAEGFFPGCPPQVHGLPNGEKDPLFHPSANRVNAVGADKGLVQLTERVSLPTDSHQGELIQQMQHVLLGCAPRVACSPARPPSTPLLGVPSAAVHGTGDHMVNLQGPLAEASSFAEDLLLEYADGMPMDQVGWGNVDEPQLRSFLALHSDYFELMHRTPALAKAEASNMLLHITHTLEQTVERKNVSDAIGPQGMKIVMIAGHDTNIAGVAALLGVHWTLDGRNDDTPPGTELAFELWQDDHGTYSVRVTVAMQTLHQLREMQELTPEVPPARSTLNLPGCNAHESRCGWESFRTMTDRIVN